jgi:hypothetical protein
MVWPVVVSVLLAVGLVATWRERYLRVCEEEGGQCGHDAAPESVDPYHSELYHAVKCADKNLGFARNIIIFSKRPQVPPWISEFPRVRVVHHDQVFEGDVYSGMITCAKTSHIPGLSEHYIQMDDDMYIMKPMTRADFFTDDGKPVLRPRRELNSYVFVSDTYSRITKNTLDLLGKHRGSFLLRNSMNHQPTPCTKTLTQAAIKSIPDKAWSSLRCVRSVTDFDFFGVYLVPYMISAHRGSVFVSYERDCAFIEGTQHQRVPKRVPKVLCINNALSKENREYIHKNL